LARTIFCSVVMVFSYNGTKAFLDSFSFALRPELKGAGVTVTCLLTGATETTFFERADMLDTHGRPGEEGKHPVAVAKTGFDAMMDGKGGGSPGWRNKLRAAIAHILPAGGVAEQRRSKGGRKRDGPLQEPHREERSGRQGRKSESRKKAIAIRPFGIARPQKQTSHR
jgi:hypothetical protein